MKSKILVQRGNFISGEAKDDLSGYSVVTSANGSIVAVIAPINDNKNGNKSSHVRVFVFSVQNQD